MFVHTFFKIIFLVSDEKKQTHTNIALCVYKHSRFSEREMTNNLVDVTHNNNNVNEWREKWTRRSPESLV